MGSLDDKTALVTGGSTGIGRGIVKRLAAEGALVAVHYGTDDNAANRTVKAVRKLDGRAFPIKAALGIDGDAERVLTALEAGLREHGDATGLDILVNNAATGDSAGGIDSETPEAFDRLFAINVRAPFFLIQRALPLMGAGGSSTSAPASPGSPCPANSPMR